MIYGSVCSGIEAATVAWHPLGWRPAFFSEIEKFPCAALAYHYPHVTNYGDMTTFKDWSDATIDLLVGGTPCQSFSVAGLRKGLDDPRGSLMLTFGAIARKYRPNWLVWENVPGVLSSNKGRDFGAFLGMLAECGYGFAYRILDAQYFGVPQRRRRVFVVGYFGDWRPAAAVLFERHSLQGHSAPRRKTGQDVAGTFGSRSTAGGGFGGDFETTSSISHCLNAGGMGRQDYETETLICFEANMSQQSPSTGNIAQTITRRTHTSVAIPIHDKATRYKGGGETRENDGSANGIGIGKQGDPYPTLGAHDVHSCFTGSSVRRLMPIECERLQGFPDDYTLIPGIGKIRAQKKRESDAAYAVYLENRKSMLRSADGPRYKALGNSMAVPVMRWIGERIDQVNSALNAD